MQVAADWMVGPPRFRMAAPGRARDIYIYIYIRADGQTESRTDGQTDRQTNAADGQTDPQTDAWGTELIRGFILG